MAGGVEENIMPETKLLAHLKAKGYKLTQQRQQIMDVLLQGKTRLTAQEIFRQLKERNLSVSLDTVYRNLRLLTAIGIVQQISLQSGAVYELVQEEHHHHLVCVDCEKIVCISSCPAMQAYLKDADDATGFDILGHNLELYGRCDDCRNKKTNSHA